jgi:hypothetical protein
MPRLSRLHFAAIGHRDARLAPLTLDFRGEDQKGVVDTVLWLRNGGGKSSIINLFYALFKTRAREFLGASAEGKARRLDDYIKARDLAFVLTEWDVGPQAAQIELLAAERPVRLVGQVIAWRGQQRSTDISRLRRLFFSLRSVPGIVTFDDFPAHGLGSHPESFDAFRDWLREMTHRHPALEINYTESHASWQKHLEQLGLDPELFRYQLQMNRREGAADEAFRFSSAYDFVTFLLELAFDTATADQLAKNLEAQRDSLKQRPRFEAEQQFIVAALEQLHPLVEALGVLERVRDALDETLQTMAATLGGMQRQVAALEATATQQTTQARAHEQQALAARNEHDRRQRWARGLTRLSLQLDVQEARAALEEAQQMQQALQGDLQQVKAALALQTVFAHEAALDELRAALRRVELDLEPLRKTVEQHGGLLFRVLGAKIERLKADERDVAKLVTAAEADRKSARTQSDELQRRLAVLGEEVRQIDARLERRDRARQRLLEDGLIERREPAADALARHLARSQALDGQKQALEEERLAKAEQKDALQRRRVELQAALAARQTEAEAQKAQLDEALGWRDRLGEHPLVQAVEGSEQLDLDAPGLEQRVRHHAHAARRRVLDSRVQGAESERGLAAIESRGLLPSPNDVERVVDVLRERGVNAHAGPAYVAENVARGDRRELLVTDPARFGGVIVVDPSGLEQAAKLAIDDLSAPLQISYLRDLEKPFAAPDAHVLPPDGALYDPELAQQRRTTLETSINKRRAEEKALTEREQALNAAADDLRRYLARYGAGKLDSLQQRLQGTRELIAALQRERAEIDERELLLAQALSELRDHLVTLDDQRFETQRHLTQLQAFIDEHEAPLEKLRARRDEAVAERDSAERKLRQARVDEARAESLKTTLVTRQLALAKEREGLVIERDDIGYRDHDALAPSEASAATSHPATATGGDLPSLAQARAAYEVSKAQYERRLSENKIQWQIEQEELSARAARAAFLALQGELSRETIERWLAHEDLAEKQHALERDLELQIAEVGSRQERQRAARDALRGGGRREADDLPPDKPRPKTAVEARELAEQFAQLAQKSMARCSEAEAAHRYHAEQAKQAALQAHDQKLAREKLIDLVVDGSKMQLPEADAHEVPQTRDAIAPLLERLRATFLAQRDALQSSEQTARTRAEGVQRVATEQRFSELKLAYRERLSAATEQLFFGAPQLTDEIQNRLVVIEKQLAQYDEDRRVLVDELLQVADQVATLFVRTGKASVLPTTLDGWAGRPYVRIAYSFPQTTEERRARLEPLVDRLVQQASLPNGLQLVCLTARELAGPSGFDVKILKPDAILRPDPISITAMSTFSRGQQLTAAILLYCTLVQLRARSRGRGRGSQDAGVLLLDNPIGTCSNVRLLELQRLIARQMRVQLIYATGVEDLEALEVLPNKIRLRNTHRDRLSGDFHVTDEAPEDGLVQAVRVASSEVLDP